MGLESKTTILSCPVTVTKMTTGTLDRKHELLGVQHRGPLVLGLLGRPSVAPPLSALTPEVGAAVHAGNVENGDALQGDGAEVQADAITLS